jgi:hypothetical protein
LVWLDTPCCLAFWLHGLHHSGVGRILASLSISSLAFYVSCISPNLPLLLVGLWKIHTHTHTHTHTYTTFCLFLATPMEHDASVSFVLLILLSPSLQTCSCRALRRAPDTLMLTWDYVCHSPLVKCDWLLLSSKFLCIYRLVHSIVDFQIKCLQVTFATVNHHQVVEPSAGKPRSKITACLFVIGE